LILQTYLMIFYFYMHVIVSVLHHSYTIIPQSKKNYILVVLESKKKKTFIQEKITWKSLCMESLVAVAQYTLLRKLN